MTVDLGFLSDQFKTVELFRDGINADRAARDYKRETFPLPTERKMTLTLMQGGGFAAKITR